MAMKGNAMLAGLIGLGVAAVVLAIMAPLIQSAFVAPTSTTFSEVPTYNATVVNGTTVTLPLQGHAAMLDGSLSVYNSTDTLASTNYVVNYPAHTVQFKIAGAGRTVSGIEFYTVAYQTTDAAYQSNAVNRTLAPFVLVMLFVAIIAMIAIAYL